MKDKMGTDERGGRKKKTRRLNAANAAKLIAEKQVWISDGCGRICRVIV